MDKTNLANTTQNITIGYIYIAHQQLLHIMITIFTLSNISIKFSPTSISQSKEITIYHKLYGEMTTHHIYPNNIHYFITTIEDCFLQQLILQPTSYHKDHTSSHTPTHTPSILDLLLTNTPDFINNINHCA